MTSQQGGPGTPAGDPHHVSPDDTRRSVLGAPGDGRPFDRAAFLQVVRNAPLVSLDLVVSDPEGRVLVGWRVNEPARDCWFVPGGRIRKDESLTEAFDRLCRVELGVAAALARRQQWLRAVEFLGVFEHRYGTNFAGEPGVTTHYVVLAYALRLVLRLECLPQDQHSQYAWRTPADLLAAPDVHPNTQAYFRRGVLGASHTLEWPVRPGEPPAFPG